MMSPMLSRKGHVICQNNTTGDAWGTLALSWSWKYSNASPSRPAKAIENFCSAARKNAGPGQHMESFGCMGCENREFVRKAAKIYVFHNKSCDYKTPKTLRKLCKIFVKSLNFCNILQNSSVLALQ